VALSGGFTRGWRLAGAAEGLGTALVVVALVGALVYATSRPTLRVRLDLTESEQYTLSEQTRSVLAELDEPITLVTLMRPELQVIPNGLFEVQQRAIRYVENLLEEYVLASGGRLELRRLDPNEDRVEAERLARELHLTRYNVVVVQGSTRSRQVFLEEMVTIDRGLAEPGLVEPAALVDLRGEAPLTSAVLAVSYEQAPRIGFLRGYGCPSLDDPTDGFGLALLLEALRGQGMEPEPIELLPGDAVPDELDVLVVWGPGVRLGPAVIEAVTRFRADGGGLMLGVDPLLDDADLDGFLDTLGVRRERTVLCRRDELLQGPRRAVLAINRFEPEHPVTAPIERQGTFAVVDLAGGLARVPAASGARQATALALTGEDVFGDQPAGVETPGDYVLGEGELLGSRAIAYALEGPSGERAVVFGSPSFLTTVFLSSAEGGRANLDLGLNSLHWLLGREEAIAARPRQVYESRVDLLDHERRRIILYVLGLLPLGGASLGVLVWFMRRR
jgi:hypothetical protein